MGLVASLQVVAMRQLRVLILIGGRKLFGNRQNGTCYTNARYVSKRPQTFGSLIARRESNKQEEEGSD